MLGKQLQYSPYFDIPASQGSPHFNMSSYVGDFVSSCDQWSASVEALNAFVEFVVSLSWADQVCGSHCIITFLLTPPAVLFHVGARSLFADYSPCSQVVCNSNSCDFAPYWEGGWVQRGWKVGTGHWWIAFQEFFNLQASRAQLHCRLSGFLLQAGFVCVTLCNHWR